MEWKYVSPDIIRMSLFLGSDEMPPATAATPVMGPWLEWDGHERGRYLCTGDMHTKMSAILA
jgi:hypothetical protein